MKKREEEDVGLFVGLLSTVWDLFGLVFLGVDCTRIGMLCTRRSFQITPRGRMIIISEP